MNSSSQLLKELKEKGFRLTRVRKALVEEMDLARKPLSVAELKTLLGRRGLCPHKTSVYRALNTLLAEGIVKKISFGEVQSRYELAGMKHHHHAICEKCGEIEDVDCAAGISEIEKALQAQHFQVSCHSVEFFGLCKECRS